MAGQAPGDVADACGPSGEHIAEVVGVLAFPAEPQGEGLQGAESAGAELVVHHDDATSGVVRDVRADRLTLG